MSSFWKVTILVVGLSIPAIAMADRVTAALTPPLPSAMLPSPVLRDDALRLTRLVTPTASAPKDVSTLPDLVARQANISNFGTSCAPSLTIAPKPEAMLAVQISAPCLPSSLLQVTHENLSFTLPLSMTGDAAFLLPALSPDATVIATLADGTALSAHSTVPELANFARVALQWSGADPGALIAKAPKALNGEMIRLGVSRGAEAKVLHVFSRRVDDLTSGVVRLSLRTDITANNCATGHTARVHRIEPRAPVSVYDIAVKGPGCGAIGQSLELNNVLQDLKLAHN